MALLSVFLLKLVLIPSLKPAPGWPLADSGLFCPRARSFPSTCLSSSRGIATVSLTERQLCNRACAQCLASIVRFLLLLLSPLYSEEAEADSCQTGRSQSSAHSDGAGLEHSRASPKPESLTWAHSAPASPASTGRAALVAQRGKTRRVCERRADGMEGILSGENAGCTTACRTLSFKYKKKIICTSMLVCVNSFQGLTRSC